jgi:hypothetical protein
MTELVSNFPPLNEPNYNKRVPDLSPPGQYPYVEFWQFRDGSWTRRDVTPGSETHAHGHITGSFHETDVHGSHKHFQVGMKHDYTVAGHTSTVEMNQHRKHGGSTVDQTSADHFSEHGKDHMRAKGGDTLDASGGIHFHHASQGTQITSSGDHTTDHNDGNHHVNILGDHVTFLGGTKYQQVGAEYGVYTPNGNIDFMTSKQAQIRAAANINHLTTANFVVNAGANTQLTLSNHNVNATANMMFTANGQTSNLTILVGPPGGPQSSIVVNSTAIVFTSSQIIMNQS